MAWGEFMEIAHMTSRMILNVLKRKTVLQTIVNEGPQAIRLRFVLDVSKASLCVELLSCERGNLMLEGLSIPLQLYGLCST